MPDQYGASRLHDLDHADSAERATEQMVLLALQAGTQLSRDDIRSTVDVHVRLARTCLQRRVATVLLA